MNLRKQIRPDYTEDIEKRLTQDNDVTNLSKGSYTIKRKPI